MFTDGEKQGYEESLTKFKGGSWPWDLWTFFINIVGMKSDTVSHLRGMV